jgi:lysophospholipase L1-like esterase
MLRDLKFEISDPQIIATTGWTTDELSRGINAADPHGPYALVSLLIGVNNQFRGRDINDFREQFAELLKRAVSLANNDVSRVIVLSIPDWGVMPFAEGRDRNAIGEQIDQFNAFCREECEKHKVTFIDITPISRRAKNDPDLIARDGLHPSGRQYRLWAEAALPAARGALLAK